MVAQARRLLVLALTLSVLSLGIQQAVGAATYGSDNYGACAYQTGCPAAASSDAPNTGVQPGPSLLWPTILGILGFSTISFVVIRYLNRGHHTS
jgi:hypothetical protein